MNARAVSALVLLAALGLHAHAGILPDAIELPVATRHLQHNDRLNNRTPGIVLQWLTPLQLVGSHGVRAQAAIYRNSDDDPTIYAGLHAEWRVSGPLFAGAGLGATYGYKSWDYSGTAWRDGVPYCGRGFCGRRFERREFRPAAQVDARWQVTPQWSITAHLVADQYLCRRQPDDVYGLKTPSCAVWVGVRREWP
ncbi:MAG: hypothetical protein AB7I35_01455 [Ramlibacter sp.]